MYLPTLLGCLHRQDEEAFNADFAAAFSKLLELGVPSFGEAHGKVAAPGLKPNLGST